MKPNIRLWITPVILVTVALIQIHESFFNNLTPWKGGGFGMFSSTKTPSSYFFRLRIKTEDGIFPAYIPSEYDVHIKKIRSQPSKRAVENLSFRIFNSHWIDTKNLPNNRIGESIKMRIEAYNEEEIPRYISISDSHIKSDVKKMSDYSVIMEVWRSHFNRRENELENKKLYAITIENDKYASFKRSLSAKMDDGKF